MKRITRIIYQLLYNLGYWLDTQINVIEEWDYESAPYCGHYHNGHRGYFTESTYHEGDGGQSVFVLLLGFHLFSDGEVFWTCPIAQRFKEAYIERFGVNVDRSEKQIILTDETSKKFRMLVISFRGVKYDEINLK